MGNIELYRKLYAESGYGMGDTRMSAACIDLLAIPCRSSFLDVGCGRGEMLEFVADNFLVVRGTEVVPELIGGAVMYGDATDLPLPDNSFDVVTMLDVLEHLQPGDEIKALKELGRVANRHILVTANNGKSVLSDFVETEKDADLHINKRPLAEWDSIIRNNIPGTVKRLDESRRSGRWRIDL